MLQRGRKPALRLSPIQKPWSTVAKISASASSAKLPSERQGVSDLRTAIVEADEGECVVHVLCILPHHRKPGAFGTGIDFHHNVLNGGRFSHSLLQNDGEGKTPKNGGLSFLEQFSSSCSMTGHQRLSVLVKHKSTNVRLHKNPFPLRESGRSQFQRIVLCRKVPLANVTYQHCSKDRFVRPQRLSAPLLPEPGTEEASPGGSSNLYAT